MRKALVVIGCGLLLAGCVDNEKIANAEWATNDARCGAAMQQFQGGILDGKVEMWGNHTGPMMVDETLPNAAQQSEMRKLLVVQQSCENDTIAWTSRYREWRVGVEGRYFADVNAVLMDLMVGKITFGEANRRFSTLDQRNRADVKEASVREGNRKAEEVRMMLLEDKIKDNTQAIRDQRTYTPPPPTPSVLPMPDPRPSYVPVQSAVGR